MKGSRLYDSRVLSPLTVSYPYVLCMCLHTSFTCPKCSHQIAIKATIWSMSGIILKRPHGKAINISVNVHVYSILECICIK